MAPRRHQTLALSRFALPGGSFAFIFLYLAADIFYSALATLTDIFVHSLTSITGGFIHLFAAVADISINFLASFTKLPGKFICAGSSLSRSGFSTSDRLFCRDLCFVAQLNGFILNDCACFLSRLWSEKQGNNGSGKPTHNEAYQKGPKFITFRHSNLLFD